MFFSKTDKNITVNVSIVENKETPIVLPHPEPDMTTKPKDIVGYCFAFVCPKHHINRQLDSITINDSDIREVCSECGEVTKLATIKRSAEAQWVVSPNFYDTRYHWRQVSYTLGKFYTHWNKLEFIKFIDLKPKTK